MRLAMMVGSGRKDSYNLKIGEELKKIGRTKGVDIEILGIKNLPMFDQDIEKDTIAGVEELRQGIREADGVIFVTPEHNLSIPVILKNAIDWLSRVDQVLIGKPGMVVGSSMGFLGTVNAQSHLRDILNSPGVGVLTLPGNQVYIGSVHEKFDGQGNFVDEKTLEFLSGTLENFIDWIEKIK